MTLHQTEHTGIEGAAINRESSIRVRTEPLNLIDPASIIQAERLNISLQQQQTLYDRHSARAPWRDTHIQLSEIGRFQNREQQNSLHEQSWAAIPSRSFTMFQQLFSTRNLFVVPGNPAHLMDGCIPSFPLKQMNPEWYSVFGCQVDPARLNPSLIKRLRLPEPDFSYTDGTRDPYAATILALKYLWESLRPLPQSNHRHPNCRVLIVTEPNPAVRERYQEAAKALGVTINPDLRGTLVYVKGAHSGQESSYRGLFRTLHLQHFTSVYDAARKTVHEQEGYSAERELLGPLYQRWHNFRESDLSRWVSVRQEEQLVGATGSSSDPELIRQDIRSTNLTILTTYRKLLEDSLQLLRRSTNSEKKLMATRVSDMLEELDQGQERRINPNPAQLRITANQALLLLRSGEIKNKDMYNSQDQYLLNQTIKEHEGIVETFRDRLEQHASIVHGKRKLFNSNRLTEQEIYRETAAFLREIDLPNYRLRDLVAQPFLSYSHLLNKGHADLVSALQIGNRDRTEDALLSLHAITIAHRAQMTVQKVLQELCKPVVNTEAIQTLRQQLQEGREIDQLFKQPALFHEESSPADAQFINKTTREISGLAADQIAEALLQLELPRDQLKDSLRQLLIKLAGSIQKK